LKRGTGCNLSATTNRATRAVLRLRALRVELHARDAGTQARERGLAVAGNVVNRLDGQPNALAVPQSKLTLGLQNAVAVYGFDSLSHDRTCIRVTRSPATWQAREPTI
jgi:hypothetical protein